MQERGSIRTLRRVAQRLPRGKRLALAAARLHGNRVVIEAEPGVLVEGDLDDYVFRYGFLHGFGGGSWARVLGTIRPGDVVLDVGANIGLFTLLAANRHAIVHAFEPDGRNVKALRRNLELNGLSAEIVQAAVGDREGTVGFQPPASGNSGMGHLGGDRQVPMVTLDGYCEGIRVALIKIDVEGAEPLVLEGARRILERDRPDVIVEADDSTLGRYGNTADELAATLTALGYRCERCRQDIVATGRRDR